MYGIYIKRWWHCVLNLDEGMNIAITQNYVSSTNLPDVLRFLEHKPQQISGCRDRPEAIKPDYLLESFVSKLRQHRPTLLSEAQELANQGWHCNAWKDATLEVCDIESCDKRRKGISIIEQAKLSHAANDEPNSEMNHDSSFRFSFL